MNEGRKSVFLERQSYRRRRLVDTIRILPLIGALLWAVPLLWPNQSEGAVSGSDAVIYIFVVWFGLVIVGAMLSRAVSKGGVNEDQGEL
ncbi:hypothetical protein [Shimia sp.]|uniref:hypothetical protein n=1 Tax=Shimia sp. TaxID=1954381 RepID=UPI003296E658